MREAHEDALRTCDGVVVLYGSGNDFWLRRKLTDLEKSPGLAAPSLRRKSASA